MLKVERTGIKSKLGVGLIIWSWVEWITGNFGMALV